MINLNEVKFGNDSGIFLFLDPEELAVLRSWLEAYVPPAGDNEIHLYEKIREVETWVREGQIYQKVMNGA